MNKHETIKEMINELLHCSQSIVPSNLVRNCDNSSVITIMMQRISAKKTKISSDMIYRIRKKFKDVQETVVIPNSKMFKKQDPF